MSGLADYPLVLFLIKGVPYAVTSQRVQAMTEVPKVVPVPHAPNFVRGLINHRGQVVPLVDLRRRLGLPSAEDELREFTNMLAEREREHRDWLTELENSVLENRPFNGTTDPHECSFGRWIDNFQTEDPTTRIILRQFHPPHQQIHAVAEKVIALGAQENFDEARALIETTRDHELAQMIALFRDTTEHYRDLSHEIVLVIEAKHFVYALAVDAVESVESLEEHTIQELPPGMSADGRPVPSSRLGRAKDGSVVQILDVECICSLEDIAGLEEVPVGT